MIETGATVIVTTPTSSMQGRSATVVEKAATIDKNGYGKGRQRYMLKFAGQTTPMWYYEDEIELPQSSHKFAVGDWVLNNHFSPKLYRVLSVNEENDTVTVVRVDGMALTYTDIPSSYFRIYKETPAKVCEHCGK